MSEKLPTFWSWFLFGSSGGPGYRRLINAWLLFHMAAGALVAKLVAIPLDQVAEKALFPLLGIFVGLTFSWAGNAHALLQTSEVQAMAASRRGGISEYVFSFQLCILIVLVTIGCWVLPGLKLIYLFDAGFVEFNYAASACLYCLMSLALRTSWQSVLGANMLLLAKIGLAEK